MKTKALLLDTPEAFRELLARAYTAHQSDPKDAGSLHCPKCGGVRVFDAGIAFPPVPKGVRTLSNAMLAGGAPPNPFVKSTPYALAVFTCTQCDTTCTSSLARGPDGDVLVQIWTEGGGVSTPNTHEAVRFYLDQAERAQCVGAFSAAIAMYRAALEQLMWHHGNYRTKGMLGQKLKALEADRANKPIGVDGAIGHTKSPKWLRDADPAILKALKDLGDGAIHPNGGQIRLQAAIDRTIVHDAKIAFRELLHAMEAHRGAAVRVSQLSKRAKKLAKK